MRGVGGLPGILLPSSDATSAESSIVLRPAVFVPGITLEWERGGRQHVYLPQGVSERGEDYEVVRFREMIRES
jgi:hypothetical protein